MAKGGRFPLLYWTSIALLVLMLAFTLWYFYQNRDALCRNSMSDSLVRDELKAHWRKGRIIALMESTHGVATTLAGISSRLSGDYNLFAAEPWLPKPFDGTVKILPWLKACDSSHLGRISTLQKGNQVLLLPVGCMEGLLGKQTQAGRVIFLLRLEDDQGLRLFACADPSHWREE